MKAVHDYMEGDWGTGRLFFIDTVVGENSANTVTI